MASFAVTVAAAALVLGNPQFTHSGHVNLFGGGSTKRGGDNGLRKETDGNLSEKDELSAGGKVFNSIARSLGGVFSSGIGNGRFPSASVGGESGQNKGGVGTKSMGQDLSGGQGGVFGGKSNQRSGRSWPGGVPIGNIGGQSQQNSGGQPNGHNGVGLHGGQGEVFGGNGNGRRGSTWFGGVTHTSTGGESRHDGSGEGFVSIGGGVIGAPKSNIQAHPGGGGFAGSNIGGNGAHGLEAGPHVGDGGFADPSFVASERMDGGGFGNGGFGDGSLGASGRMDGPIAPALYNFGYTVDGGNQNFGHSENRDGSFTNGQYHVMMPDGRMQMVQYSVSGNSGYVANVAYL